MPQSPLVTTAFRTQSLLLAMASKPHSPSTFVSQSCPGSWPACYYLASVPVPCRSVVPVPVPCCSLVAVPVPIFQEVPDLLPLLQVPSPSEKITSDLSRLQDLSVAGLILAVIAAALKPLLSPCEVPTFPCVCPASVFPCEAPKFGSSASSEGNRTHPPQLQVFIVAVLFLSTRK